MKQRGKKTWILYERGTKYYDVNTMYSKIDSYFCHFYIKIVCVNITATEIFLGFGVWWQLQQQQQKLRYIFYLLLLLCVDRSIIIAYFVQSENVRSAPLLTPYKIRHSVFFVFTFYPFGPEKSLFNVRAHSTATDTKFPVIWQNFHITNKTVALTHAHTMNKQRQNMVSTGK